jgi:hypothetical protein
MVQKAAREEIPAGELSAMTLAKRQTSDPTIRQKLEEGVLTGNLRSANVPLIPRRRNRLATLVPMASRPRKSVVRR